MSIVFSEFVEDDEWFDYDCCVPTVGYLRRQQARQAAYEQRLAQADAGTPKQDTDAR